MWMRLQVEFQPMRIFKEPHGINGVVDNSHLVGFRIADFDMGGVLVGANFHAQNI